MVKKILVNDLMQHNYSYLLSQPEGTNFHPDFKPELSPKQMLEMGVFGGKYMTDSRDEFPRSWYIKANFVMRCTMLSCIILV